jgi:hypothetical protein
MKMRTKLRLTLAVGLGLAATVPALAVERRSQVEPAGHDEVDYGKAPAASAWTAVIPDGRQDDSKMQPPAPAPGTQEKSGVGTDGRYDEARMLPKAR